MSSKYTVTPFTPEHLEPALQVFLENYRQEQQHSPCLPARTLEDSGWIREALRACLAHPGVAVLADQQLLAYMLTGGYGPWKGQQAVFIPEYCHSAVATDKRGLYQRMYLALAQEWFKQQIHLQTIGYLAHDQILQETLYQLGFGAIVAERLRPCSPLAGQTTQMIVAEHDVRKLVAIQIEHNRYYAQAPIFISKPTDDQSMLNELEAHVRQGDVIFVAYDQAEPCAYLIVGTSADDGEGFLLRQTNTAQIKSAYARPAFRGHGVGKALLQRAIQWAQEHGYARVFVEHETANIAGGKFWCAHFTPYVYFAMRYIDNTMNRITKE